jgi:hypothetical protein
LTVAVEVVWEVGGARRVVLVFHGAGLPFFSASQALILFSNC